MSIASSYNISQQHHHTTVTACNVFFLFFFQGFGGGPPNNNKFCLILGYSSHLLSPQKQFPPQNYISRKKNPDCMHAFYHYEGRHEHIEECIRTRTLCHANQASVTIMQGMSPETKIKIFDLQRSVQLFS